jgi:hypothetical protein
MAGRSGCAGEQYKMIWKILQINEAFIDAWTSAGEPDQAVIDAHVGRLRRKLPAAQHTGVMRRYYLLNENTRVRLATIGRPLEDFSGLGAKVVVGTHEIIGEFPGNEEFIGLKGLKLQCEPVEWLQGQADQEFATGSEALAAVSEQVLDLRRAEVVQREITQKYQWKKGQ